MKTKNAKKEPSEVTEAQFNEAMQQYAAAEHRELELNKAIEAEVDEVMKKYEDELMCLAQGKNRAFEQAQAYCQGHKEALFARRRSIGTPYGIAGYRLGKPQLKTATNITWETVLARLKEKLPEHVRTVEEPAKDLLLADRYKENVAPILTEIGVYIVQDELFYVETRKAA
jgi:phage host-nuclease inhibitor protein Gam